MNKDRILAIVKEQWGDQALHFLIGFALTYLLCSFMGWFGAVLVAAGWIGWEHVQYPNNNSKGYDDASIDRFFQELGVAAGLIVYL